MKKTEWGFQKNSSSRLLLSLVGAPKATFWVVVRQKLHQMVEHLARVIWRADRDSSSLPSRKRGKARGYKKRKGVQRNSGAPDRLSPREPLWCCGEIEKLSRNQTSFSNTCGSGTAHRLTWGLNDMHKIPLDLKSCLMVLWLRRYGGC